MTRTPLPVSRQQQAVVSVSKDLLQGAEDVEVTLVVVGSWRLNNATVPSRLVHDFPSLLHMTPPSPPLSFQTRRFCVSDAILPHHHTCMALKGKLKCHQDSHSAFTVTNKLCCCQ